MLGAMTSAAFDTTDGRVKVTLSTSTSAGYGNVCEQYQDWGHISVPIPVQLINSDQQALTQVVVTGYNNQITDPNFALNPGESCNYSINWYHVRATTGIYMQQAYSSTDTGRDITKENSMMGQSTNAVLTDILNRLIALESWADSHTHAAGSLIDSRSAPCTGNTAVPNSTSPSGNNINTDLTYIIANENLAITDVFKKYRA